MDKREFSCQIVLHMFASKRGSYRFISFEAPFSPVPPFLLDSSVQATYVDSLTILGMVTRLNMLQSVLIG
jgi:hypothetical protein